MSWYSLRVISGKEQATKENILREAEEASIEQDIEEVFLPYEKVVEVRNNKKRVKEKMFFPGYILINMDMNNQSKYVVENTPGVLSFVGPKGSDPIPLKDKEIKRIFGEVADKEGRELITTSYKIGDNVKVISGPFIDFTGNVEEVNDEKQKVKVVVSIFGRPTSVELDCFQIEAQK
jgi:transcriptional antiterminator NusG|tara:strand:+ start:433 stop:963 length:531 start_codon:yes stop_codon:yes gene_type:complete